MGLGYSLIVFGVIFGIIIMFILMDAFKKHRLNQERTIIVTGFYKLVITVKKSYIAINNHMGNGGYK